MSATLDVVHYLATEGYRVTFAFDPVVKAIKVDVDGEKDGRRFTSSKAIPDADWPYAALVLAEMRREVETL